MCSNSTLNSKNLNNLNNEVLPECKDETNINKLTTLNQCDFLITRVTCTGENLFRICVEVINPGCSHLFSVFYPNQTIPLTSPANSFCFDLNLPIGTQITISNEITQFSTCIPESCSKNIVLQECNDGPCLLLNFNSSFNDCIGTFTINNTLPIYYNWTFGDGSPAIRTNSAIVTHQFPKPHCGQYEICITTSNTPDNPFVTTCCYSVFVPPCYDCPNPLYSWQKCPTQAGEECCIDLTFNTQYDFPEYKWTINGDPQIYTTTTKTFSHNYIGIGPYYICVTFDVCGIPTTCCEWIEFPPCDCCESAEFTIGELETNNSCLKKEYIVDPICDRPGLTVHWWTFSDGYTYVGTAPNHVPPPHVFTNFVNTTGEVCIKHKITCDNITVDEVEHCFTYRNGAYLGHSGRNTKLTDLIFSGGTVYDFIRIHASDPNIPLLIEGRLEVNIDAFFDGGIWYMAGENTSILIDEGKTFNLDGTTIQSARRYYGAVPCCRWQGILSERLTKLNWTNAKVKDANIMLDLFQTAAGSNGARINFLNCEFLVNAYGIYSRMHRFTVVQMNNNLFTGCTPATAFCGCSPGIGIVLENVPSSGITIPLTGIRNEIRDYEEGVYAINSNLSIKNFYLNHLTNNGIWFIKNNSLPRNLTIDFIEFDNLKTAVLDDLSGGGSHSLSATASIPYSSLITSFVHKAYDIRVNTVALTGNIVSNEIVTDGGADNFGVKCNLVASPNNKLNILTNHITVNGGTSTLGVSLTSDADGIQLGKISNNVILNNATNNGAGVYVQNWKSTKVLSNIITTNNPKIGIEFTNAGESLIKCNIINDGGYGMSFSASPSNDIESNTCFDNKKSLYFLGDCNGTGTYLAKNKFTLSTFESILYDGTAITGVQEHNNYNKWYQQNYVREVNHPNLILAPLSHIYAPIGSILGSVYYPSHSVPAIMKNIGLPAGFPSEDCPLIGDGGISGFHLDPNQTGDFYNNLVSSTDYLTGLTLAEQNGFNQSIYELILKHPSWITDFNSIATFYNTHLNDFIGHSMTIRNQLIILQATVLAQSLSLQNLYTSYNQLIDQITALDLLISNTTDPIILQGLYLQMDDLVSQITILETSIDNQQIANYQSNQSTINGIEILNNLLETSEAFQIFEKEVNVCIIKSLRSEVLSNTDITNLRAISQMCYGDGGRAVHSAKQLCIALLNEYNPPVDCGENIINASNRIKIKQNLNMEILLEPNPVSNELSVLIPKHLININSNAEFGVYDLDGKSIRIESSKISSNHYVLNTEKLVNGIYFIELKSGSHKTKLKFMVAH